MEEELALLRQENERLKLLVQLLSDKMATIVRMTAGLHEFATGSDVAQQPAMQNDAPGKSGDLFPNTETPQGQRTELYPTTTSLYGINNSTLSFSNYYTRIKNINISRQGMKYKDKIHHFIPFPKVESGKTPLVFPIPEMHSL